MRSRRPRLSWTTPRWLTWRSRTCRTLSRASADRRGRDMTDAETGDAGLGDTGEIARAIRALEDRRYQAMTAADVATLDELLSDDLVYGHSDATRDTKKSYLDRVAGGYFDYGPLSHPESGLVIHGD